MAKNQKVLTGNSPTDESGGRRRRLLSDEGIFDRRTLLRLGSWGIGSIAAMTIAILAHQSGNEIRKEFGTGLRHEQNATAVLARQSQQLQSIAKASENEISRLASAIDTLNGDRDRLFARITVLEQGLDSVTGSINRDVAPSGPQRASSPQTEAALDPPVLPPPDFSLPAKQLDPPRTSVASNIRSMDGGSSPASDSAAPKPGGPDETAAVAPATSEPKKDSEPQGSKDAGNNGAPIVVGLIPAAADAPRAASPPVPVAHTDFGVDLGSAASIKGLRALWRNVLKSEAKELTSLHPIIVVKEGRNGIGMQLRLVAGPLADAADAARICAVLSEKGRACETAVFEGQRLAMNEHDKESGAVVTAKKPRALHPLPQHRHGRRAARAEEPAQAPPPPPTPPAPQPSTLGSFFSH